MIRLLRSEDIPVVADLVRQSFSPSIWPYMTYMQHGLGAYLDVAVRYPRSVDPRYLVVSTDPHTDKPVGFADFKVGDGETGFLSYICVDPAARGRGIATTMFESFLDAHPGLRSVGLDTFRVNTAARSLYERWGFSVDSTAAWVTRALPPAADPPMVHGLTVSLAAHEVYGFCELQLESSGVGAKLGVLGETVVRCFSRGTFEDDTLLASAHGLLPGLDTAFAVVPEPVVRELEVAHDLLLLSDRMTVDLGRKRTRT